MKHPLPALLAAVLLAAPLFAADPPKLEPKKGNVVAVIGNTFADRMQHSGWFDAYLHTRFPELGLRVRHLGFSADEVGGYTSKPDRDKRLRSVAFGSGDEWFARVKADIVVACFGYNESWAGKDGLDDFKKQLADFITHTRKQKYNGTAGPQLALVGPIAFEDHKDKNLPNGKDVNERLKLYNAAMAEVAKAEGVAFVDLFEVSQKLYADAKTPLTSNGIHPTPFGYQMLANHLVGQLAPGGTDQPVKLLEAVRTAALDRNATWYQRYRATDGFSVYGGRADLKFTDGQTNRVVAQRELEIIDVLTANRDDLVNAVAQGKPFKLDDSNTPAFIPVKTNKPGKGPNGEHLFLSGEEAIEKMKVAKGLKVNLFADEKMFKDLVNPVQMAWDTKGRLWVATWPTYPHWTPKGEMNDKLIVLEDTNGDGKADKCTTFAGDLHNPTGFEFWNGGVIVSQAPDLVFLKDTDGDGKYDVKERLASGYDTADTHHTSNSFAFGPGGDLYFQEGTFHHSQIETPYGPAERVANGAVFRYDPRTQKPSVYVTFGFANPHGHVFDKWGQDIVVDGTGAQPYHAPLFSSYLPYGYSNKHKGPPQVYQQRTRPCGGMEFLSSSHFPEEYRGNLIVTNCIGFQGLLRYKIEDNGASLKGTEIGSSAEPFLSSSDEKFRPVEAKVGPDGAIYVADWHNPIIGHMQHNLRDPSRDREHGRIYRVSYEGREPLKAPKIAGEKIETLLDLLKSKDDRTRHWARTELSGRKEADVIPAAKAWVKKLDEKDADFEHHRTEALWVHQHFNAVDADLLTAVLTGKDGNARAAAVRVLTHWRDKIPGALETLKKVAADPHPRVRLMAVWASSYFTEPDAVEVVLVAGEQPKDPFVEHLSGEALRAINVNVQRAIAAKTEIKFTTAAGAKFFLKTVGNDDLLKLPRSTAVYTELLGRKGVRDEFRREAATELAKDQKTTAPAVLLATLNRFDTAQAEDGVPFDLVRLLTDRPADLKDVRADLEKLATGAKTPLLRQLGYVALVAADGNADAAFATAVKSVGTLRDFVQAVPSVRDPLQRAALYPKLLPLLEGLPKELKADDGKAVTGRTVRITLPGRAKTLTLAEVEVYSDGKNVARQGKAKQINTAHGGAAARAIDGNKSGKFADGGQTHTEEGTMNPWWEVDLGAEVNIDSVVIYNRTDADLDSRLSNYTVTVTDGSGKTVFELTKQPNPPNGVSTHKVSAEQPTKVIRRAAMLALTSVREKEAETFQELAKFVGTDDRAAAVAALQRIPVASWNKDDAPKLLEQIAAFVAKVPEAERTTPAVLDALQFGDSLAGLLPKDQAKAARTKLGALGVRVIRVGTLTDQMVYDKDRIVVQAGKPVEFVFENTDIMPHNFAITLPGALQEVGDAAELFGTQPGAQDKHFIPPSNKILLGSKLLQPQGSQVMRFNVPKEPGVYPYVCTYPGHWRRMHGALYVVADLDAYTEEPEKYVAAQKIEPKDELLKFNRPRTEWKLEELTPTLAELDKGGRSFARGKQIFNVAACAGCHKFDGGGKEFGPDLTKLDEKVFKAPADLLKHVLQPSERIDDKYKSYKFDLLAGGSVTGMLLEEAKGGVYKVIENPLLKGEPKVLKLADLDGPPKESKTSIMPKGLLDKLTKDEILDLVAYVWAKHDPKNKYFEGGDHKHGHGGGGH